MKIKAKRRGNFSLNTFSLNLAIITLALILGILFGCVFAKKANSATLTNLINTDVLSLLQGNPEGYSVISTFINLMKYPTLVFFASFSAFGLILVPCLVFLKGFFLSLSVSSIISAFGKSAFLTTLSIFGFQSLVLIPLLLLFSSILLEFSKPFSKLLLHENPPHGKRQIKTSSSIIIFSIILVIFFVASLIDAFITPKLVSVTIKNIL